MTEQNDLVGRLICTAGIAPDADGVARLLPATRKLLNDAAAEITRLQAELDATKDKLSKAEGLLIDAIVQLEEGKIKTRRNRAVLIRQFLAELTGGKHD